MPLDPQVKGLLDQLGAQGLPPFEQMTVGQARQIIQGFKDLGGPELPVAKVEDREIPGPAGPIPLRIYTPSGEGPFPLLVFIEGGGWVFGDIALADKPCRGLVNAADCIVVSVGYRQAPEHKFPAASDDCYAATKWVADHAAELGGDASRLGIGGDSAGGNLAAVVSLMARDRGGPRLAWQLLINPVTNMVSHGPSYAEYSDGYFLTVNALEWMLGHYLNDNDDRHDFRASPWLASSHTGLPAAFILTAEFDPVRDEGEAYGEKLRASGVPVKIRRYDGMVHGFFYLSGVIDRVKEVYVEIGAELGPALASRADV